MKLCEQIATDNGLELYFADDNTEPVCFLSGLLSSSLVVTDSYHGVCFSLIFNKKYLCVQNKLRGLERFNAIIELFNLNPKHFMDETNIKYDVDIIQSEENWDTVNRIIKEKAEYAKNWIRDVIEKNRPSVLTIMRKYVKYSNYIYRIKLVNFTKNYACYVKLLIKKNVNSNKIVMFGAGNIGKQALSDCGDEILCFIDNSPKKRWLGHYPVFSMKKASRVINQETRIIITVSREYQEEIREQLMKAGYTNIEIFES